MTLGENIYYYRTQKNWSQGDLADALDVSRQSISKWENNLASPDLDKLLKLRNVFGITLDELVLGTVPPESSEPLEIEAAATVEQTATASSAAAQDPIETKAPAAAPASIAPTESTLNPTPPTANTIQGNTYNAGAILNIRHLVGFAMLLCGLIFFLFSVFWGASFAFSEIVGELTSMLLILVSLFMLAPYNCTVISICGVVYVLYCVICNGILNIRSIPNDIFLLAASILLLVWFIVCGLHQNKIAKTNSTDTQNTENKDKT